MKYGYINALRNYKRLYTNRVTFLIIYPFPFSIRLRSLNCYHNNNIYKIHFHKETSTQFKRTKNDNTLAT